MQTDTIHIRNMQDLRHVGIETLTGEACGLMMRVLCDVNKEGAAVWREALGLLPDSVLADNWNSRVNGEPSVASIMLPRYPLETLLGVVGLIRKGGYSVYICKDESVLGVSDALSQDLQAELCKDYNAGICKKRSDDPGTGFRNRHMFTGRTL